MEALSFKQVDVFTGQPFYGNPVAVVLDADGMETEEMQRIAAWTNLSETTFLLKPTIPGPAYRLRIFTPAQELPFAGHPTIGSCHALLEAGIVAPEDGRLVQECGAGNLPLRIDGEGEGRRIYVEAPEAKLVREYGELWKAVSDALGVPTGQWATPIAFCNGPTWLFARFDDPEDLTKLAPDMSAIARLSREHSFTGIAAFALTPDRKEGVHIRCFAPAFGVPEDPVTGSANAALPAYLVHRGMLHRTGTRYVVRQGTELGRDGRVYVRVLDETGRAEIGGQAVTVVEGTIRL